jgi:hypothetical protein
MPTDNSTPNGGRIIVPQPPLAHKHNVNDLIGLDVGTIPVGSVPKYTSTGWTAAPVIPDGTPNAPTITSTSTSSYVTGQDPATATSVTVNLAAPTTNIDGSAFYGAQQYFVRWRYEDSSLSSTPSSWAVIPGLGAASSISFFNVRQKTTLSVQVAVIDIYSHQSAWSSTTAVTTFTPSNPQTPSAPTVTSKLGGINVVWDGLTAAGGAMDADLDRVDIYYRSGATFTSLSQATKWDSMYRAGWNLITNLAVDTTYYVALVAYNLSGGVSGISAVSSVTVQKLSSTETLSISSAQIASIDAGTITVGTLSANRIAANSISVDRLAAGTMSANVVLGGTFATSSSTSANRVVMSSSGIAAYGGTGASAGSVQTFLLDAATGNLTLNGNGGPTLTMTGGTLNSSTINAATIRTSSSVTGLSTTAAGVVLDINGLRAYKANNASPTFSIDSTGAATFSGAISGSSITGGTLDIGGTGSTDYRIQIASNGQLVLNSDFANSALRVRYGQSDNSRLDVTPSSITFYNTNDGQARGIQTAGIATVLYVASSGGFIFSNRIGNNPSIYASLYSTGMDINVPLFASSFTASGAVDVSGNIVARGIIYGDSTRITLRPDIATLSTAGVFIDNNNDFAPEVNNASSCGLPLFRWTGIYSYAADIAGQIAASGPITTQSYLTTSGNVTVGGNLYGTGGLIIQPSAGAVGVAINSSNDFVPTTSSYCNLGTTAARWLSIVGGGAYLNGDSYTVNIYPDTQWLPSGQTYPTYSYLLGKSTAKWAQVWCLTSTLSTSDTRLKTDVTSLSESELGMNFVRKLRPVSFRWKAPDSPVQTTNAGATDGSSDQSQAVLALDSSHLNTGFIAQEVKQVIADLGATDWSGWVLDDPADPEAHQSLRYEAFVSPLVAAVQNIDARLAALEGGTP